MLRSLWLLGLAGFFVLASSSSGHAQLHSGDVRLYMDSTFVGFNSDRRNGDDVDVTRNTTSIGLLGGGGLGLAYVVNRYIVPGFYFSLQRTKWKTEIEGPTGEGDSDGSWKSWEVRPYLEIPFNASSRFVVHAQLGVSILRPVPAVGWTDEAIGVGPIGGIGGHGFITNHVSLDVSLLFRPGFIKDDDAEDGFDDPKFRQLSLMFMLGASYWI